MTDKKTILQCPNCGAREPEVYEIMMITCNYCYRSTAAYAEDSEEWHVQVEAKMQ